ncbi:MULTISPECIES: hypothetical protein [Bacillati]|uniref:Pentapeptide MXKDX repeat protein n=3 Tax=Bacillati TaxID=1783272 RepID=A0A3S2TVI1_9BACI|nr:hypothetical protein [Niallia taxi]MDK8642997.1 hypothetical protein [Niallia taxi]MED4038251.1 hypothetical protein [Niallia taxi]MED4055144.1 hypothetical protein [Niallia taxi]MED4120666.1 hypothetical protein [Niallia taxi]RVT59410.1 hypothetical protein EM808_19090 [Niallia taxi]
MKKKKITFTVLGLTLAAVLAIGNTTFAEKINNNDSQMMNSDSMSNMMNDENMSGMMKDSNMGNMMEAMDSSEGKEMMESCNKFMESSQNKEGQSDSKDNSLKPKETSL